MNTPDFNFFKTFQRKFGRNFQVIVKVMFLSYHLYLLCQKKKRSILLFRRVRVKLQWLVEFFFSILQLQIGHSSSAKLLQYAVNPIVVNYNGEVGRVDRQSDPLHQRPRKQSNCDPNFEKI